MGGARKRAEKVPTKGTEKGAKKGAGMGAGKGVKKAQGTRRNEISLASTYVQGYLAHEKLPPPRTLF